MATALICLWALAPIGGPANHARLEMRSMALDDMVGRPRAWGLIALGGLVGALLVGPVVYFVAPSLLVAGRLDSIVLGAVVGGAFGAHASMEAQRRRTVDRLCAARGCLHCGVSCAEATIDAAGRGTCPACGAPLWVGQWRTRLALTRDRALHLLVRPAALVAVMWVLLGVAYFASMVLHTKFAPVTAFNRLWFETLTPGFRTGVDVTILVLSAAIGVRLYRGRLAVIIDRQHRTCVRCRHDLQGTPTRSGMGRCGECALPFFVPLEDR